MDSNGSGEDGLVEVVPYPCVSVCIGLEEAALVHESPLTTVIRVGNHIFSDPLISIRSPLSDYAQPQLRIHRSGLYPLLFIADPCRKGIILDIQSEDGTIMCRMSGRVRNWVASEYAVHFIGAPTEGGHDEQTNHCKHHYLQHLNHYGRLALVISIICIKSSCACNSEVVFIEKTIDLRCVGMQIVNLDQSLLKMKSQRMWMWICHFRGINLMARARTGWSKLLLIWVVRSEFPEKIRPLSTKVHSLPSKVEATIYSVTL